MVAAKLKLSGDNFACVSRRLFALFFCHIADADNLQYFYHPIKKTYLDSSRKVDPNHKQMEREHKEIRMDFRNFQNMESNKDENGR